MTTGLRGECPVGLDTTDSSSGSGSTSVERQQLAQNFVVGNIRRPTVRRSYGCIQGVLVQTAKGLGDNGLWRIAKLNGILYLPDARSKTTSFSSAFAGVFASN